MCSFATNPDKLSCTIALSSVAIDTADDPSKVKSAIPVPSVKELATLSAEPALTCNSWKVEPL